MLDFGFYNMDCMEGMKEFPDNYFENTEIFVFRMMRENPDLIMSTAYDFQNARWIHLEKKSQPEPSQESSSDNSKEIIKETAEESTGSNLEAQDASSAVEFEKVNNSERAKLDAKSWKVSVFFSKEEILDELLRLKSDLSSGDVVGCTKRHEHQLNRFIKALAVAIALMDETADLNETAREKIRKEAE